MKSLKRLFADVFLSPKTIFFSLIATLVLLICKICGATYSWWWIAMALLPALFVGACILLVLMVVFYNLRKYRKQAKDMTKQIQDFLKNKKE